MNREELLEALSAHQRLMLEAVCPEDYRTQHHPDLSPLGWHLGHCVFTEQFWIRETLLGEANACGPLKSLYIPELSPKPQRAGSLPPFPELCDWAERTQAENLRLLEELPGSVSEHHLLRDEFLLQFLLQHYAQHYETTRYHRNQAQLRLKPDPSPGAELKPGAPESDAITVAAGPHRIGAEARHVPYDNEKPGFTVQLKEFHIGRRPVTNAAFLGFMTAGGYQAREFWTEPGWDWLQHTGVSHPETWRRAGDGWYAVDDNGPHSLRPEDPVYGLNYFEAGACARWAGGRLPHEYEWEAAGRRGLLADVGEVWEWCANPFHAYQGFAAYPYDGYSLPYFDGRHYTLRGGSRHTRPSVRRETFRNYYQADKRHIFAGLRLAFD